MCRNKQVSSTSCLLTSPTANASTTRAVLKRCHTERENDWNSYKIHSNNDQSYESQKSNRRVLVLFQPFARFESFAVSYCLSAFTTWFTSDDFSHSNGRHTHTQTPQNPTHTHTHCHVSEPTWPSLSAGSDGTVPAYDLRCHLPQHRNTPQLYH